MADRYRTVTVMLRQRRASSIMVETSNRRGWQAIPRSCIHGGDNLKIDRLGGVDEEITIRIFDWLAEDKGLA